jgi:hypothetical protein
MTKFCYKKLSENELHEMALLLSRAIHNEQVGIETESPDGKNPGFITKQLFGVCDGMEDTTILIQPEGLKWLWVRYMGAKGGKAKAAKTKKRDRAR